MADFNQLKTDIAEVIKANDNEEITGEVLQYILLEMVSSLGANLQLAGKATPDIEPSEPDGNIFYIGGHGTYTNFTGLDVTVDEGEIVLFMWDGAWSARKITVTRPVDSSIQQNSNNPVEGGAIYTEFAKLRAAGYMLAGIALPASQPPQDLTEKIFYFATQGGNYANFGTGITLPDGLSIIKFNGSVWSGTVLFEATSSVVNGSTAFITSGGVYAAVEGKVSKEQGKGLSENDFTNLLKNKLDNLPTAEQLSAAFEGKQDALTIDSSPEEDSNNPVSSGGVYEAIKDFITKAVNDLVNYYTKSETFSKAEVNALIAQIKQFRFEVVQTLPEPSAETMFTLYFTPAANPTANNSKDEYVTLSYTENETTNYSWERIGGNNVDLSNYPTIAIMNEAISTALAGYYTKSQIDSLIGGVLGTLAILSLVSDHEIVGVGDTNNIKLDFSVDTDAEQINLKRDGSVIAQGSGRSLSFIDTLLTSVAGAVTYMAEAVIGGITREVSVEVKVVNKIRYGAGTQLSDIVNVASPKLNPAGRYAFEVENEGDYIFVLVPSPMLITNVTFGGLDLPMDEPTGALVDDVVYNVYKSSNQYVADVYVIEIY